MESNEVQAIEVIEVFLVATKLAEFYHPHQKLSELSNGVRADLIYLAEQICQILEVKEWVKLKSRLPKLWKQLRDLERRVKQLEGGHLKAIGFPIPPRGTPIIPIVEATDE